MTNQEKIEYLKSYSAAELEIERLTDEIAAWRSQAENTTPVLSLVPAHGGDKNKIQAAVDEIIKLSDRLAEMQAALVGLRLEIDRVICSVNDERLRLILRYKYINGWSFKQIGDRVGRDEKQVRRWHEKAVIALECPAQCMISLD